MKGCLPSIMVSNAGVGAPKFIICNACGCEFAVVINILLTCWDMIMLVIVHNASKVQFSVRLIKSKYRMVGCG